MSDSIYDRDEYNAYPDVLIRMAKSGSDTNEPTFVDLFAGCGGLTLGLMQAGWRGLFGIESEENAFKTLKYNFLGGNEKNKRYQYEWPKWLPKEPISVEDILSEYEKEYGGAMLLSTQRLTDENWQTIPTDRLMVINRGEIVTLSDPVLN